MALPANGGQPLMLAWAATHSLVARRRRPENFADEHGERLDREGRGRRRLPARRWLDNNIHSWGRQKSELSSAFLIRLVALAVAASCLIDRQPNRDGCSASSVTCRASQGRPPPTHTTFPSFSLFPEFSDPMNNIHAVDAQPAALRF